MRGIPKKIAFQTQVSDELSIALKLRSLSHMAGLWSYIGCQVVLGSLEMRESLPKSQAGSRVIPTGSPLDSQKSKEHYFYIH
ncbi:hypothetical protein TNCV_3155261 [Trichonephila clavipes]|nr:hypothetical protein TNCV_3155261 [Trichonephila clavipes]